jgi:hypothetical protein
MTTKTTIVSNLSIATTLTAWPVFSVVVTTIKTTIVSSSLSIATLAIFSALVMTTTIVSSPQLPSIATTLTAWQVFSQDKNMRIRNRTTSQGLANTKPMMDDNNKPPLYHSNKTCKELQKLSTSLETKFLEPLSGFTPLLVENQAFSSENSVLMQNKNLEN